MRQIQIAASGEKGIQQLFIFLHVFSPCCIYTLPSSSMLTTRRARSSAANSTGECLVEPFQQSMSGNVFLETGYVRFAASG
jgi:hypothetical protein